MTFHHRRGILAVRAATPEQPKQIIGEIRDAFATFKTRYDGRHAEIEARLDELDKAGARLPAGGGGSLPGRVDARDLAAFFAAARKRDVAPHEVAAEDLSEYHAALTTYLRRGSAAIGPDVQAAMQVGSDPDGGYWVTPQIQRTIKQRLFDTSPMRSLASVMTITTDSVKFPLDTGELTSGGWVGETASRSDTATPEIGEQTIYVREQYAQPSVTQKLLDMAMFDVEDWLAGKIGRKLGRDENQAFVTGDGVAQPRGFLDYKSTATTEDDDARAWGKLQYVVSGASGGFPALSGVAGAQDVDALVTLQHKLKAEYRRNAVWTMNRATAGVIRTQKDGDGRWLWQDSMVQGQPPLLLGSPVVFFEDMPDIAANSFSIAYGDFMQGYQIVDGPGLRILRDPYTNKPFVRFYATKWTGGDVTDTDAIKLLKFGTS